MKIQTKRILKAIVLLSIVGFGMFFLAVKSKSSSEMPEFTKEEKLKIKQGFTANYVNGKFVLVDPTDMYVPNRIKAWRFQMDDFSTAASTYIVGVTADGTFSHAAVYKNSETASGTTNASGIYTVTFTKTYSVAPVVTPSLPNQVNRNENVVASNITTTGCTLQAFSVNLLTLTYPNLASRAVDCLITEK